MEETQREHFVILDEILAIYRKYHGGISEEDERKIKTAFLFSFQSHEGQYRKSGEMYFVHPAAVAKILAELGADVDTICAGLLHDVVEDCNVSIDEIRENFGEEVAKLVDGVTKIDKIGKRKDGCDDGKERGDRELELNLLPKTDKDTWNLIKFMLFSSNDPRVAVIKVADRLHNMRTVDSLPPEKRVKMAEETLRIFAPIAHQLGLFSIKTELEDLSFKILNPEEYERIRSYLERYLRHEKKFIERMKQTLFKMLRKAGINVVDVKGRVKGIYSIKEKMERLGVGIEEIHDIVGFRIITKSFADEKQEIGECWKAVGIINSHFVPVEIEDYISKPKPNGYRAIHLTVLVHDNNELKKVEIQVKSERMEEEAEKGICAHWIYKEKRYKKKDVPKEVVSVAERAFQIIRERFGEIANQKTRDEIISRIQDAIARNEIYVFTPKGDVKFLPKGSTVLDFAFLIHTELGQRCIGARVNGVWRPISWQLEDGDIVEVETSPKQEPSWEWLKYVKTYRARQKIKEYLRKKEKEFYTQLGEDELKKELARHGLDIQTLKNSGTLLKVASALGLKTIADLYINFYFKKIRGSTILKFIRKVTEPESLPHEIKKTQEEQESYLSDIAIRPAKCCSPVEGDELVGFVSRGKGIVVHRRECDEIKKLDPERIIPLKQLKIQLYPSVAKLKIQVKNNGSNVLHTIEKIIRRKGSEINEIKIKPENDIWSMLFFIKVRYRSQLEEIIKSISELEDVITVQRV